MLNKELNQTIRQSVFETNSSSSHSFTARGTQRLSKEVNTLLENTNFINGFIDNECYYLMSNGSVRTWVSDEEMDGVTEIKHLDKNNIISLMDGYFCYYIDGEYKGEIYFSDNVKKYMTENNLTQYLTDDETDESDDEDETDDETDETEDETTYSDELIISLLKLFSNPTYSLTIKKTSTLAPLIKIIENDTVVYLAVTLRYQSANTDSQGGIDSQFNEITQEEFDEVVKSFVEL